MQHQYLAACVQHRVQARHEFLVAGDPGLLHQRQVGAFLVGAQLPQQLQALAVAAAPNDDASMTAMRQCRGKWRRKLVIPVTQP